jgi:hypothetical protein
LKNLTLPIAMMFSFHGNGLSAGKRAGGARKRGEEKICPEVSSFRRKRR